MGRTREELKIISDNMPIKTHYVYILECEEQRLYCGMTGHVIDRFVSHASCDGAEFTKKYKPISLLHLERLDSYMDAILKEMKLTNLIKNKVPIQYSVVSEYQGIFCIIQEMLLKRGSGYVKRRLNKLDRGE